MSFIQGVLFAALNTLILGYIGEELKDNHNLKIDILPRVLIFHFCMCFILGLVFMESINVRMDAIKGPVIGPLGGYVATLFALYFVEMVVFFTDEFTLLTPVVFAVAFIYGQAKAANHVYTIYQPIIVSIVILSALVVLLIQSDYVDEFANEVSAVFNIEPRSGKDMRDKTYLMGKGGLFTFPFFIPIFVTLASYGLMWSQIESSSTNIEYENENV